MAAHTPISPLKTRDRFPGEDGTVNKGVRTSTEAKSILESADDVFRGNDHGILDNPLFRLEGKQLDGLARAFVHSHDLGAHEEVFVRAAQILRNPERWANVPGLTGEEREALTNEHQGFWKQPKQLRVTIFTLAVAAILQGWNQTSANGANLNWPGQLGLSGIEGNCQPSGSDAWIFGIVNAATYLSAGLVGCWFTDPLGELIFGRRSVILVSGLIILASVVGGATVHTWQALLATRIVLGIGMGMKASVVPVMAAEVAPAHIRGSLVMNWQLFDALGILLGFTANLAVSNVGPTLWRWQIASSVIPAIILISLIYVCPESPRFLLKRGYNRAAYESMILLRYHPILAAKELFYIHCQIEVEDRALVHAQGDAEAYPRPVKAVASTTTTTTTERRTWASSSPSHEIDAALTAAVVVMLSQQLCGVNILAFLSSTFFCSIDSDGATTTGNTSSLWFSWGIGLANFVFAFPAYWLIDRKGRRWLLLTTIPGMALSMLAAGLSFKIADEAARRGVIVFFTYVFMLFYSPGMGPVPFTLSAEVFPLESRMVGMSFAVFINLFGAGLLGFFVPPLTTVIGQTGVLSIFFGLNIVAFILVFFLAPETAGAAIGGKEVGSMLSVSLEELSYIFAVSTPAHARYQLKTVIPWAWSYYFRRDPDCPSHPKKLYTWAQDDTKDE